MQYWFARTSEWCPKFLFVGTLLRLLRAHVPETFPFPREQKSDDGSSVLNSQASGIGDFWEHRCILYWKGMGKPGTCSDPHVQDGILENYGARTFLTSLLPNQFWSLSLSKGNSYASSSHRKPQTGGAKDQILENTSQKQDFPT